MAAVLVFDGTCSSWQKDASNNDHETLSSWQINDGNKTHGMKAQEQWVGQRCLGRIGRDWRLPCWRRTGLPRWMTSAYGPSPRRSKPSYRSWTARCKKRPTGCAPSNAHTMIQLQATWQWRGMGYCQGNTFPRNRKVLLLGWDRWEGRALA